MNEESSLMIAQVEQLLLEKRLDTKEREVVQSLLDTLQQLQAENKRLRTALVKANNNKPKMSSRLKDALYE